MNVWFISDTHFGHSNILKFESHGAPLRVFSSVEEMDEVMIERWNKTVKPGEKIYHLGDLGFSKPNLEKIMPRLNGQKRLILGNHDGYQMKFYEQYFKKIICSWRPIRSCIFSHHPLYIGAGNERILANVHGHIHRGQINDPRYLNISVEETDYYPIHYDQIIQTFKDRGIDLDTPSRLLVDSTDD